MNQNLIEKIVTEKLELIVEYMDEKFALLEEKFNEKISEHEKAIIEKIKESQNEMLKALKAAMENTKDTILATANIIIKDILADNKQIKAKLDELKKSYSEYADIVIKNGDEDAVEGLTIVTKKFAEIIERLDEYRNDEVDDLTLINKNIIINGESLVHIAKKIDELAKLVEEEASKTRRRVEEESTELSNDIRKHGDRIFDKLSRNW